MDSSRLVVTLCCAATLVLLLGGANVNAQGKMFMVTDYGAVSDGVTDNSKALLSAWKNACSSNGGGVGVPSGTYLVITAKFQGPCHGQTFFKNMGTLKASSHSPHGQDWLSYERVDGLTIYGFGTFDGNGASAWSQRNLPRPASIKISRVKNMKIEGISSLNSKKFHFHIILSHNVRINGVTIRAPGHSPNTDGIHVSRCTDVSITNTRIATGDDCISLGDGSKGINIDSVICGPGHGISIGSLGRYSGEEDVTRIRVKNCTLIGTTNGLRIKTWAPSSVATAVSNVTFHDVKLVNVKNPIIIDQFYCPKSPCTHERHSDIKIHGVKYINVRGTSTTPVAVNMQCSSRQPCQNIELHGVGITTNGGQSSAVCSRAKIQFRGQGNNPSNCERTTTPHNFQPLYEEEEFEA